MRLRRTFKVEYYNIYSVESRILLREVEAAVFKILIAIFRLLTGVQGVRISPGSTVVDFIALFSQNDTNEAPPASLSVETELLNAVRNDSLENIDADNGSNLTVVGMKKGFLIIRVHATYPFLKPVILHKIIFQLFGMKTFSYFATLY